MSNSFRTTSLASNGHLLGRRRRIPLQALRGTIHYPSCIELGAAALGNSRALQTARLHAEETVRFEGYAELRFLTLDERVDASQFHLFTLRRSSRRPTWHWLTSTSWMTSTRCSRATTKNRCNDGAHGLRRSLREYSETSRALSMRRHRVASEESGRPRGFVETHYFSLSISHCQHNFLSA